MVEINLLPQQYRKQSVPSAWRYATYALIPLTVAAILIPEVVTATRVGDLNRTLDALNGEAAALTPAKREFDSLTAEAATLAQVTAIAEQLKSGKTYWTNDLAAFTRQLPDDGSMAVGSLTIRDLDASGLGTLQQNGIYIGKAVTREIDLTGTATSQQAVVNFLKSYEDSPDFGVNFKSLQSAAPAAGPLLIGQGRGTQGQAAQSQAQEAQARQYTFTASIGVVGSPPADTAPTTAPTPAAPTAPTSPAGQGAGSVN
ncbi:fimbrial assembly protein [Deinococcus arenicola]|uniref:Fimbrial assembly protein n=1 Tax=Deinococcus arenicola TaxID=2994950 RepID=A0ABU4DR93_9DEIO|nr:fimbrial assembly protein [Deinococcus sp. ZS9-10]MDV6374949.1 fimbrial assembly protein [Deinococcus sp. ZS9-10]